MLGRHKLTILLSAVFFAGALSFANAEAIDNLIDHPIMTVGKPLSVRDVSRNIVLAGLKRHWHMEEVGPNELKAIQTNGKETATVSITFTSKTYSIRLLSSVGLDQSGDSIGRRYNGWVHYLTQDIDDQLAQASISGQ